jgi:hypothetical protein
MKLLKGLCVSALLLVFAVGAGAQVQGVGFEGIRADGMGGAYTSVAEGYEAIFYNPAGLTKTTRSNLLLPSLYVKGNQDAVKYLFGKPQSIKKYSDVSKLFDHGTLLGSAKGVMLVGLTNPGWAFNVYGATNGVFACTDTNQTQYREDWAYQTDLGAILSMAGKFPFSLPFLEISLGLNFKYVYRQLNTMTTVITYATPAPVVTNSSMPAVHGYGLDAGVICRVLGFIDAGVMFKDVVAKVGDNTVPMQMTVGASTKLLNFITLSMDLADLTNRGGDFLDKVKLGAEVNLLGILKVRGGLSQKFPTFGAGVSLFFLNVDYAFMGEKPIGPGGITTANPVGNHAVNCSLIF